MCVPSLTFNFFSLCACVCVCFCVHVSISPSHLLLSIYPSLVLLSNSYIFITYLRKELFEGLATLTLPAAIKTALELADRRLQKQMEKVEKGKNTEKKGGKKSERQSNDEDELQSPSAFQNPTVRNHCEFFVSDFANHPDFCQFSTATSLFFIFSLSLSVHIILPVTHTLSLSHTRGHLSQDLITTNAVERRSPEGDGEHTDRRVPASRSVKETNREATKSITNQKYAVNILNTFLLCPHCVKFHLQPLPLVRQNIIRNV